MNRAAASRLREIALFDFDGTVTYRDTLMPFLLHTLPARRVVGGVPTAFIGGFGAALQRSRDSAKEAVCRAFLHGLDDADFRTACLAFAATRLPAAVRPEATRRIDWHRGQGHRLVLVSASLEGYLAPWAEAAGFDDVLATRLQVLDGRLTGRLDGANCRGAEKVRRIRGLLGDLDGFVVHAYGDSAGDREMLALADFPYYRTLAPQA